jgi:glutathione-independent formaldehyde dehydrogenase
LAQRLAQARSFGCETLDIRTDGTISDKIHAITGSPTVDAAVDCVGFEARGMGKAASGEVPAQVLNDIHLIAHDCTSDCI